MKSKCLKVPALIIAIGMILSVAAYLLTGMIKEPTITEHDFNYSATYQLGGETKTLEGVYRVRFKSVGEGISPLERYYEGEHLNPPDKENAGCYPIAQKDDRELCVVFIFADSYLMGDDKEDAESIIEPYLAVFDENGAEYDDTQTIEQFDAELISWELPQPIENSFVFCGFSMLYAGSMFAMLLVGLMTVVACMIFVKKDQSVTYKALDRVSVVINYVVALGAIPFITFVVWLMQIFVSGDELIYRVALCIPVIIAFTVAASIALRRKGFTKTGFFIQFVGLGMSMLIYILESIVENLLM